MMRLFMVFPIVLGILLFGNGMVSTSAEEVSQMERAIPPYAKWGQIAIQRVKEKYPRADIIDYLHVGKEKGATESTEKFKLWLRQNNKEFGVFVDISFDNATEKITKIQYKETTR